MLKPQMVGRSRNLRLTYTVGSPGSAISSGASTFTASSPASGGAASFGENVAHAVQVVVDDVQSVVIPDTGHFLAEESPDEVLAALTAFLAPYRAGSVAAHDPEPHAAAASSR